ncbi:Multicopper oxidase with three cupredoxin domains (includes cell division protein FtsP and spore coat protein CotA) [Tranquillimonas rosea]|uniref:Multicopper oxidase with three cupredoxin domains (Includes cell division protein FtsP and spore coat protein CotA) n=1 Tax=Tranquillimonas rosea TaxID=641238 RepID=A0A1H9SFK4_9RHOB|nr:multicopper oxidase family protein [Tranquillimonas rosea]SER83153.1 Multicopper oxidase with three cupredoxin domains (includes cell division protein FtsP and spore coat protein CotA) [Tranquillimonas rosea]
MPLTRRQFTTALIAAATARPATGAARAHMPDVLRAGELGGVGGQSGPIWAYDGMLPGPVIHAERGRRVVRRLENGLPVASAVHWHGTRIDSGNGGADHLLDAVAPGSGFLYDFAVRDAGTYWYRSLDQARTPIARGLHGFLIVGEEAPPDIDEDLPLAVTDRHVALDPAPDDHTPRLVTCEMRQGQRLRLRMVNASAHHLLRLEPHGLTAWIAALDGMPLPQARRLSAPFLLAPGQRADILADVTLDAGERAALLHRTASGPVVLATFPVTGRGRSRRAPLPLEPNPLAQPMRRSVRRMVMRLSRSHGPDGPPLFTARAGETVQLRLTNDSTAMQTVHLHGHHMHLIDRENSLGAVRDTVLIRAGDSRQVIFVADNPGDWMIECHSLAPHHKGRRARFRVT